MSLPLSTTFKVSVSDGVTVTAKLNAPAVRQPGGPLLILAHGANNDLDFPLLSYLANRLAEFAGVSTVRFNFPYVERGVTSPDARPVLEGTFTRVYEHVVGQLVEPGAAIFVGGKSLGGRTAAELVSRHSEGSGVAAVGLVILGYPLHAPGHKERLFLDPLRHIDIPSLFCIGSRDSLCDPALLPPVLAGLVAPGTLYVVKAGDHSLHLPRSRGRQPDDSYEPVAQEIAGFVGRVASITRDEPPAT
jgi:predicted alpha/beta-hydrolase family hydrolase